MKRSEMDTAEEAVCDCTKPCPHHAGRKCTNALLAEAIAQRDLDRQHNPDAPGICTDCWEVDVHSQANKLKPEGGKHQRLH